MDAHNLLLMLQAASNAGFIMLEEDALNVLNQKSCSIILPHWSIALIIDDLFLALVFFFFFWSAAHVLRPVDLPMSLLAGISCNQVGSIPHLLHPFFCFGIG